MLLGSMRQGGGYPYGKKELARICIIVCVFLIGNSIMLITTSNLYGLQNLNAPLQKISAISTIMEGITNAWAVVPMLGLLALAVCSRRIGNKIWANR